MDIARRYAERRDLFIMLTREDRHSGKKTKRISSVEEEVKPVASTSARLVPIPLLPKLQNELNRLQKLNIIEPVNYYTPWVSPIVIVPKGHVVTDKGVEVDSSRVEAIGKFTEPLSKREPPQFLEMVNFASRFIPNKSSVLDPLTRLLKNDTFYTWEES
ncbi:hypothetical protein Trydic_g1230 [Trypoxylus dichotomus]